LLNFLLNFPSPGDGGIAIFTFSTPVTYQTYAPFSQLNVIVRYPHARSISGTVNSEIRPTDGKTTEKRNEEKLKQAEGRTSLYHSTQPQRPHLSPTVNLSNSCWRLPPMFSG
jgi:hypothetical protein